MTRECFSEVLMKELVFTKADMMIQVDQDG